MRTKIIVTVGPSSASEEVIKSFIREGVAGFRINFSHGNPQVWDKYIDLIRASAREYGVNVAIIGDLRGPQVRVGDFKEYRVKKGELVKLVYGEKTAEEKSIPLNVQRVFEVLDVGDRVLLDDGKLVFHVYEVKGNEATLLALNDGIVSPRKTIIIPGKDLGLPVITNYDMKCIEYAVSRKIDYLALSYVRNSRDIVTLRDLLEKKGGNGIGVIAKIETRESLRNLSSILRESDASIVARGDLGMYFSLEEIPSLQKKIVYESIKHGKPVIVATQLLESMVNNPQPTRSEIIDVINAVKEQVDALLLTTETAMGKYPVEAVKWLKRIIRRAEKITEKEDLTPRTRLEEPQTIRDKFAKGLVLLAESLSSKIIVYTKTGFMPSRLSRLRPSVKILVGTNNPLIARKLMIYYGIESFLVGREDEEYDYEQGLKMLYNKLLEEGKIEYGDIITQTYGRREEVLYVVKVVHVI